MFVQLITHANQALFAELFRRGPVVGSIKWDGRRACWDGGISRGLDISETFMREFKTPKNLAIRKASGLWSRDGNIIPAPDEWLDNLPEIALDGELWTGDRAEVMSITQKHSPCPVEWAGVAFKVFDLLPPSFFGWRVARVRTGAYSIEFTLNRMAMGGIFRDNVKVLTGIGGVSQVSMVDVQACDDFADDVMRAGHEGAVFRSLNSVYEFKRTRNALKIVAEETGVGVVVDQNASDKQDGFRSLVVKSGHVVFEIGAGFTQSQRRNDYRGRTVSYRYTDLSRDGIPRHAIFQGVV